MIAKRAGRLLPILSIIAVLALVAGAVAAQTEPASPFLGVSVADDPSGVLVVDVLPDGPAAAAGVQVDDIITAVDGETAVADELGALVSGYAVGDEVELDVLRGEETLTLTVTLADRADFVLPESADAGATPEAGTQAQLVTPRAFLGVALEDSEDGVTIRNVVSGSPAEEAGLESGDVVTVVNDEPVETAQALVETISGLTPGDVITLDYTRDGEAQTAEITLSAGSFPGRDGGRGGQNRGQGAPGFTMRGMEIIIYNPATESWQVVNVSEDSALYEAGLRSGDVITAVDGETYDADALEAYLDELDADAEVTLSVERDGETQDITVPADVLEDVAGPMIEMRGFGDRQGMEGMIPFHDGMEDMIPFHDGMEGMMPYHLPMMARLGGHLGVTFVNLDETTAAEHEVDVTEGALVTAVAEGSPAAAAGLLVDDVITAVDGDLVDAERTLRDRLAAYEPEDTVTLTVLRDGEEIEVQVTLGQPEDVFMGGFNHGDMLPFFGGQDMPDAESTEVPADAPSL